MSDDKEKWGKVESLIGKTKDISGAGDITKSMEIGKEMIKSPEGIIQQYKAKKIERKYGIELVKEWYEKQLEVTKYQLKRAAEVKTKETDLAAERFLAEINKRHLDFLKDLEFKNLDKRYEALGDLTEKTARTLEKISKSDWPEKLLDDAINGVVELHRKFFEKILEE